MLMLNHCLADVISINRGKPGVCKGLIKLSLKIKCLSNEHLKYIVYPILQYKTMFLVEFSLEVRMEADTLMTKRKKS